MRNTLKTTLVAASALFAAGSVHAADNNAILANYADIALAGYQDALTTAETLDAAIAAFLAAPGDDTLAAAKTAWLAARVPYQQTEAFRFGNAIVDDWEGRVNAWPLDEGLIDYVDASYGTESDDNGLYTANVIASTSLSINGETVEILEITPEVIAETLQEAGGVEANVASGYHAVEFLLWGQDLNGTDAGAGARPASDFSLDSCTNGNCDRRRQYLSSASALLVADLEEMVGNWEADGAARAALETEGGLSAILTGMGSLSYGELAGERMKLGLLLHDPEEEHDCFSDNTANSHYFDGKGIQNVYLGSYTRIDGSIVSGPSLSDLVAETDPALDTELKDKLSTSVDRLHHLVALTEDGMAYDQQIGEANQVGNDAVQSAIDALVDQTRTIERIIAALNLGGVSIEGSDSLDSPEAVFQ